MVDSTVVSRRAATASPISKVSTEVICSFFRESFKYKSTWTSMTLSHVSRTWRQISIEDPYLWNSIHLTPRGPTSFSKLCLARSKQANLDIHYSDGIEYQLREKEIATFDPAILHLHRCRELKLVFADRTCAITVMNILKREAAARLVSFEVILNGRARFWLAEQVRSGDIFTGGAPLLTSLTLHGVSPLECHAPLSNITKMSLTDVGRNDHQYPDLYPSEFIAILREVVSTLKHLELEGCQVFSRDEPETESLCLWSAVELPVLVTLNIRHADHESREECMDYHTNFWKFVRMPALEDLSLSTLSNSQVAEVWLALKGEWGARMRSLSLDHLLLSKVEDTLAERFPNLHSLSLGPGKISSILKSILSGNEQSMLSGEAVQCPELQHLDLMNWWQEGVDMVQSFLRVRMAAGYPIKQIVFRGRALADAVATRFPLKNVHEVIIKDRRLANGTWK